MKTLSFEQMANAQGGQPLSAGCIASLVGLGAAFVGIFCISGPLGAAVWYVGTMATAVGTGVSC